MHARPLQSALRTHGGPLITLAAAALLLSLTLVGCGTDTSETGSPGAVSQRTLAPDDGLLSGEEAAVVLAPTFDELEQALDLRPEQVEPLRAALETWRDAQSVERPRHGRGGERGGERGGRQTGGPGGMGDGSCTPDPEMCSGRAGAVIDFLAECNRILDTDQFVTLAQFLSERRAERRAAHQGSGAGSHGEGFHGGRHGGHGGSGMHYRTILEELELTEEQRAAVEAEMETLRAAMRELHADYVAGNLTREELQAAAAELHAALDARLQEILTPEQLARLEELRCERQAAMAERRIERLGQGLDHRLDALTRVLALDDDQQRQIRSLLEEAESRVEALLNRVRECEITMREVATEQSQIRDEVSTAIRAVLTPDQAEIFDALHDLMAGHGRHLRQKAGS